MLLYLIAALLAPIAMFLEARHGRKKGLTVYDEPDTLSNLSQFFGEMILTVALRLDIFAMYGALVGRFACLRLPEGSWTTWVLAFLALDFLYYVGHRCLHAVGPLWALHTVHHQSTEYNFSVGIRGPWLSALQTIPFMFPLALLGFPPSVLVPLYALHTVYKLAVHTQLIGSLGPLDAILVSPRMHGVHHSIEARHIDKNFGGVLCVWDRLFGTFVEGEPTRFGIVDVRVGDPLADNVNPWLAWLGVSPRVPRSAPSRGSLAEAASRATFVLVAVLTLGFMVWGSALSLPVRLGIAVALLALLSRSNRPRAVAPSPGPAVHTPSEHLG